MSNRFTRNLTTLRSIVVAIGVPILVFMAISQGVQINKNTTATNKVISQQTELLKAIKQVATDNNLTAVQQADTIICMLQVPIAERTPDTKAECRRQSIASNAGNVSQTSSSGPSTTPSPSATTSETPQNSQTPSSHPTSSSTPAQQDNVQPGLVKRILDTVNIFN